MNNLCKFVSLLGKMRRTIEKAQTDVEFEHAFNTCDVYSSYGCVCVLQAKSGSFKFHIVNNVNSIDACDRTCM